MKYPAQTYQACLDHIRYDILLIDSDTFFAKTIQEALIHEGHRVEKAASLHEARTYLDCQMFDYLIIDLDLPDGDAEELIISLQKIPQCHTIILTNQEDTHRRDQLFGLGILDYFFKTNPLPLIVSDLKEAICKVEVNKTIHLLIINNSAFMRKKLANILHIRGFILYQAANEKETIELLKNETIHLILFDFENINQSEISILRAIKSLPKAIEIPLLVLSSSQDKDTISRLYKMGIIDLLTKPFVHEELLLKCDYHARSYLNQLFLKKEAHRLKKLSEQANKENRNKSTFLSSISHELRTPLSAILGFIKILKESEEDRTKREYITIIENASNTLLEITNDILDYEKINQGALSIETIAFDPTYEITQAVQLFLAKMEEKSIHFTFQKENLPPALAGDPLRIKQILSNLLSNAIKFTPSNKQITLIAKYQEPNLTIQVKDEGIGISKKFQKTIFQAFTQEKSTTARQYGGSGLGLSISYALAKAMQGELEIESEVGCGSTFTLTLPLPQTTLAHSSDLQQDASFAPLHGTALIVEDNVANQHFLGILLKHFGLSFEIANDGIEAVEKFQTNHYDIILMDENMPRLSGIEATQKIRAFEKEKGLPPTPILSLSAAINSDKERYLQAGMNGVLRKPIDQKMLYETLQTFLKSNQPSKA